LHIQHWLLNSAAYKGLSNQAECILVELMRRYDGGNNGNIGFGGSSGAHAGFSADVTERALTELQRAGLIVQTALAVPYLRRPRKARPGNSGAIGGWPRISTRRGRGGNLTTGPGADQVALHVREAAQYGNHQARRGLWELRHRLIGEGR
jgi:hypothetical protein